MGPRWSVAALAVLPSRLTPVPPGSRRLPPPVCELFPFSKEDLEVPSHDKPGFYIVDASILSNPLSCTLSYDCDLLNPSTSHQPPASPTGKRTEVWGIWGGVTHLTGIKAGQRTSRLHSQRRSKVRPIQLDSGVPG